MSYSPQIYDWRKLCAPIDQVFRAGGQSVAGGMTLGGASYENPQPGGRGELVMNFAPFAAKEANLDASWTISRMMAGAVFRIPLYNSVQLVLSTDIPGAPTTDGLPWDNNGPWDSLLNWEWSPASFLSVSALAGSETFTVTLATQILKIGHVIGFSSGGAESAHTVMDISYSAGTAEVTVSPPLRRDLSVGDPMLYRPKMLATCINAREVMTNFQSGRHMTFGTANFVEVLL